MSSSVISPSSVSRSTPIWARSSSVIRLSAVTAVVLSAGSGEGGDMRQLAADDQLLDLRGALVQPQRDRVTQVALHRVLAHVAEAAVDLDRVAGGAHGALGSVVLRH